MKEVWKDIPTAKEYQISNMGRVRKRRHFLRLTLNDNGYLRVSLNGKPAYVHRLVAKAFIPNPHHYPDVNHKDEDKQNDQVNNLEWCTSQYNNRYGEHAWKQARSRFYNVQLSKGSLIRSFPSMEDANFWLRAYGGIHRSKYTIRDQLRRCCWGEVQDVFSYKARFITRKGSSWQTSLFDKPRQMSLFGRD